MGKDKSGSKFSSEGIRETGLKYVQTFVSSSSKRYFGVSVVKRTYNFKPYFFTHLLGKNSKMKLRDELTEFFGVLFPDSSRFSHFRTDELLENERLYLKKVLRFPEIGEYEDVFLFSSGEWAAFGLGRNHLVLVWYGSFKELREVLDSIKLLDGFINEAVGPIAYSPKFGYLTPDVRDSGVGLSIFTELFVPGVDADFIGDDGGCLVSLHRSPYFPYYNLFYLESDPAVPVSWERMLEEHLTICEKVVKGKWKDFLKGGSEEELVLKDSVEKVLGKWERGLLLSNQEFQKDAYYLRLGAVLGVVDLPFNKVDEMVLKYIPEYFKFEGKTDRFSLEKDRMERVRKEMEVIVDGFVGRRDRKVF